MTSTQDLSALQRSSSNHHLFNYYQQPFLMSIFTYLSINPVQDLTSFSSLSIDLACLVS